MTNTNKIPIKNIYYMLCYAWNVLERSDNVYLGEEKFDHLSNLLARVFLSGVSSLVKRGVNRYYIPEIEVVSTLKGKINTSDSIKQLTFINGKMSCEFDDFSKDIMLNRIIKTTINRLVRISSLDVKLRSQLLKFRAYFSEVEEAKLSQNMFNSLRYNKNNYHYRLLINISELLFFGLITNDNGRSYMFSDFEKNNQMAKLYEKFVFNFYKKHLDEAKYYIHSPKIKWNLDEEPSLEDLALLPEMRTDIVIENKESNTQIIIDTKYYAQTLASSIYTDNEKIRTSHLYQILTYTNNSNYMGKINGLLLYPTIEKEIDASYSLGGRQIRIRTLNLNSEWTDISKRLLSLVD